MITYKKDKDLSKYVGMKKEFQHQIDGRLKGILLELDDWAYDMYRIPTVITCLNRSKEENERLGGVPWSAHLFGRGADIRSHHYTEKMIQSIVRHLEETWGDMIFIKYHDSGSGDHIHINIKYAYRKEVIIGT